MSELFWYRLLLRLELFKADGMAFQNLVNSIFDGTHADFQPVAPWGNKGDGGNDGYIPSSGHYLQVYGPKASSSWKPTVAARKAQEDFSKLKEQWAGLKRYSFVLNDRFDGVPAPVELSIQEIQSNHSVSADCIPCAKLTNTFMALPDHLKMEIVHGIPNDQPHIDKRAMGELLDHLANKGNFGLMCSKGLAPDFDEKLVFNGLSDIIGSRLRAFSYQDTDVIDFFNTRDQWLAQAIAQELREFYNESKSKITGVADAPDLRYVWMLDKIVPDHAKLHPHTKKAFEAAAEVILAHYFEACDVYDKPTTSSRTA